MDIGACLPAGREFGATTCPGTRELYKAQTLAAPKARHLPAGRQVAYTRC